MSAIGHLFGFGGGAQQQMMMMPPPPPPPPPMPPTFANKDISQAAAAQRAAAAAAAGKGFAGTLGATGDQGAGNAPTANISAQGTPTSVNTGKTTLGQ